MEKQKLLTFGLMATLVIGIVFISGCVQQESPKTPTTTQPSETLSAEITTADELNNKIVRCIELTDIKKIAEGVPTDTINSYVCIAETIRDVKDLLLCEKITRQSIRDYCIVKLTENLEDVSVCEKLIDQKYRFACIGTVAVNTLDVSLCDRTGTAVASSRDGCIFNIAVKKRDTLLCTKLTSRTYVNLEYCTNFIDGLKKALKDVLGTCKQGRTPSEQVKCIADTASLAEDVSICDLSDKLKEPPFAAKAECIFLVAARTGLSLCEKVSYEEYKDISKDDCIIKVATERKDLLLCDKLSDTSRKEKCIQDSVHSLFELIWHVDIEQMKKGQPSIGECEKTESLYKKDECYYNRAINAKDFLICKKIEDSRFREKCYLNLSIALRNPSLCNEIFGLKDECYKKQVAECEKIGNSEEKIACYILVGRALKGIQLYDREKHVGYTGYSICEVIDEGLRQNCYEEQRKECEKIEKENERDGCYHSVAIGLKDSKLCEKIIYQLRRQDCYNRIEI